MLDRVVQRARGLRASLSDIVWAVDPQLDRLYDLVNRMRDTVFALLESDDCRVNFNAPLEEILRGEEPSPERRRQLLLFFKVAITNVARHLGATRVRVQIELSGRTSLFALRTMAAVLTQLRCAAAMASPACATAPPNWTPH